MRRAALVAAVLAAATATVARPAGGQVEPHARWRTFETTHFSVHYAPGLEPLARYTAAVAESAWVRLARDLVPPRGPLDIVVADNVDYSNGYAGVYPSNRIVVYAHPPVTSSSLRWSDEWMSLLVTHELTHLFHLDRSRGWWRAAQRVFGRDPIWFPNLYLPSWVVEGLAVYEESKLSGAGRAHGSHHMMIGRAAALGDGVPRINQLSLGRTAFPQAEVAYAYGGILFDELARHAGDSAVRRFVERTSAAPVPFFLNRRARESFGIDFERAWQLAARSLGAGRGPARHALEDPRRITDHGWFALHPRWVDDSTLVYVGTDGRETSALQRVNVRGRRTRLGERNGLDPNDSTAHGWLFSQPEYLSPYVVRADLWSERAGKLRRMTRGARLTWPDARHDGLIVATQAVPGTTRLVLLDSTGRLLRAITPDDSAWWSQPRWSPDGRRIAAVRQVPGPLSEIVLLDTTGALVATVARGRAILSAPAFSARGDRLFFTSDLDGTTQIYAAPIAEMGVAGPAVRVSDAGTGVFYPAPHPTRDLLAASLYLEDGYHLVIGDPHDSLGVHADTMAVPAAPAVTPARGASRSYRPWRSLVPRYWRPVAIDDGDELAIGASTTGNDIVERHEYYAEALRHLERNEWNWAAAWSWRGLGQPTVDVDFSQQWQHYALVTDTAGAFLGTLRERARDGSVSVGWSRPRVRTAASLRVGLTGSWSVFAGEPRSLLPRVNAVFSEQHRVFGGFVAAGWTFARRPPLAISIEDGVRLTLLARHRRDPADGASWNGGVVSTSVYKSLNLPGYSHHVLAGRVVAGVYDGASRSDFSVGGVSGQALEILPGLAIGGGSSTFPVRGFSPGTLRGTRVLAGSLEYRMPLFEPARGIGALPLFFDRSALVFFGDAAAARCPAGVPICPDGGYRPDPIASLGAELWVDAALQYDAVYRFRLGVARRVAGADLVAAGFTGFLTLGTTF